MGQNGKRADEDGWLTLEETAAALGETLETVRRSARDGDARIPAYKVWDDGDRARFRFKKVDVEAFKAQGESLAPTPAPPTTRPSRS